MLIKQRITHVPQRLRHFGADLHHFSDPDDVWMVQAHQLSQGLSRQRVVYSRFWYYRSVLFRVQEGVFAWMEGQKSFLITAYWMQMRRRRTSLDPIFILHFGAGTLKIS